MDKNTSFGRGKKVDFLEQTETDSVFKILYCQQALSHFLFAIVVKKSNCNKNCEILHIVTQFCLQISWTQQDLNYEKMSLISQI